MDWSDEGVVLSARKHGESAAILNLLTRRHGRHAGLVHGGAGRRKRGMLQPGNEVAAHWRARLSEHLGTYTVELKRERASRWLDDALRLAALAALCQMADKALPEREPHPALYEGVLELLDAMASEPGWAALYVRWELVLLRELGFGLDLSRCAVSGGNSGLAYVSPRTGRAVSAQGAGRYAERLLKLPPFVLGEDAGEAPAADIRLGLALTGHFLECHVFGPHQQRLPPARTRFVERYSRQPSISGDIRRS